MTEMLSWHRVGQKVVCLEDNWDTNSIYAGDIDPVKGQVYTIREIVRQDDGVGFRFVELNNPSTVYVETVYQWQLFRPVDEPRTSVFDHLLSPTPEQRRALETHDAPPLRRELEPTE